MVAIVRVRAARIYSPAAPAVHVSPFRFREFAKGLAMTQTGSRRGKVAAGIILLLLVAAGGSALVQRESLLAWYSVRQLVRSNDADRDRLAQRVAEQGGTAAPGLVNGPLTPN